MTRRLRSCSGLVFSSIPAENRHIPCGNEHTGQPGLALLQRAERTLTTQAHDTATPVATRLPRRAGAGTVRLSQRDIDGLMLCGEHYGAPFDLLAAALRVSEERVLAITARWRRAGDVETRRLGPGPGGCWLGRGGMAATG